MLRSFLELHGRLQTPRETLFFHLLEKTLIRLHFYF